MVLVDALEALPKGGVLYGNTCGDESHPIRSKQ
jgi:hypothetical protein